MTAPWTCPVCNRGVAPGVTSCDHGAAPTSLPIDEVEQLRRYMRRVDDAVWPEIQRMSFGGRAVCSPDCLYRACACTAPHQDRPVCA